MSPASDRGLDSDGRGQTWLRWHGQPVTDLAATLADVDDVDAVLVNDANAVDERLPLSAQSTQ